MRVRYLFLSIFITLVIYSLIGCLGEIPGLTWDDIPIYPQAELELTRNWTVLPEEEQLSEVEWRYYLAEDKYSVDDISLFYESEMPDKGWQETKEIQEREIIDVLSSYITKINYYVPIEVAGRISEWGYFSKGDGENWAALWIGINDEWEKADKTYIVILIAR